MKKLFYPLLSLLILTACNKETLPTTDTSVSEKISGKTFRLVQLGEDQNGNGIPDNNGVPGENELKYTDTTTTFEFMLNQGGTGHIVFANKDTSGNADLSWTIDASETYITSTIPALHKTVVSKIITITDMSVLGVVDTVANPKWFAYFLRDNQ
jgi:hypothetical protein